MGFLNNARDHDVSVLKINLATWEKKEKIGIQGRYIFYADGIADIEIKFNSPANNAVTIPKGGSVKIPNGFDCIYIDGTGTDTIKLYIFEDENAKVEIPPPSASNSDTLDGENVYSVTTTATKIWEACSTIKEGAIFNNSTSDIVYLGSDAVTTADGFPLKPQSSISLNSFTGNLYGITTGATADVRMMRIL